MLPFPEILIELQILPYLMILDLSKLETAAMQLLFQGLQFSYFNPNRCIDTITNWLLHFNSFLKSSIIRELHPNYMQMIWNNPRSKSALCVSNTDSWKNSLSYEEWYINAKENFLPILLPLNNVWDHVRNWHNSTRSYPTKALTRFVMRELPSLTLHGAVKTDAHWKYLDEMLQHMSSCSSISGMLETYYLFDSFHANSQWVLEHFGISHVRHSEVHFTSRIQFSLLDYKNGLEKAEELKLTWTLNCHKLSIAKRKALLSSIRAKENERRLQTQQTLKLRNLHISTRIP
jgi:hypothetical protein